MSYRVLALSSVVVVTAFEVSAGVIAAAPLPIAGAAGPVGLAVAILGYGAYRFYSRRQDK